MRAPGKRHTGLSVGLAVLISLALILAALPAASQGPVQGTRGVASIHRVVNFAELAAREALAPAVPRRRIVGEPERLPRTRRPVVPPGARVQEIPVSRVSDPTPAALGPVFAADFAALGDDNTAIPPDTQGAVGPNHLMVALNSQTRVQDKTGGTINTMSLDAFWASTGTSSPFDPKVLYDPFSNRWVFVACSDSRSASSSLLIGSSRTTDPNGTWDLFRVDADATNTDWADYPSVGFNKDWIVVTVNMFSVVGSSFAREDIYVFKKADLYAGTGATFTLFSDANAFTQAPAQTYDNTLNTLYLVEEFNGNAGGNGFLRISRITGSVGSEVYTAGNLPADLVGVPSTWDFDPGGGNFAPQLGTVEKIQNNDARMLSAVYRNGSLWAAHTVFLPANGSTRSAVQWWQFLPDTTLQQFGRVDDNTGVMFFAFPSLAVNVRNDALIGYSTFSANQFASAAFSFRAAGDPVSTLRPRTTLKAGEASYFKTFGGAKNRWGDYSNTVVDPANDVDFWTIQEYAATAATGGCAPECDRWGTWWGKVTSAAKKRRGQVISQ